MSRHKLETGNRLLLLHGISQIENGLEMLEWMECKVNENSFDILYILRDRFNSFKETSLDDGKCDTLLINKAVVKLESVNHYSDLNNKIQKELKVLRNEITKEMIKQYQDTLK